MYLHKYTIISALAVLLLPSCADDKPNKEEPSQIYADDYYTGGKLGTSFNHTASAYEQFTPAVEEQGLVASFKRGERIFESPFDTGSDATQPMRGLGPLWVRTSCIACHPSYGHGQRQTSAMVICWCSQMRTTLTCRRSPVCLKLKRLLHSRLQSTKRRLKLIGNLTPMNGAINSLMAKLIA